LPITPIQTSDGAIAGIGTRSVLSGTSGEIFWGQLLRWFYSLIDYSKPSK
jgi:hypothetical protein